MDRTFKIILLRSMVCLCYKFDYNIDLSLLLYRKNIIKESFNIKCLNVFEIMIL
jgi:hypothetical protein